MIERRIVCDRCRNVILENRAALTVQCGPLRRQHDSLDLCGDCQDLLINWLAEFSPEATLAAFPSPEPMTAA